MRIKISVYQDEDTQVCDWTIIMATLSSFDEAETWLALFRKHNNRSMKALEERAKRDIAHLKLTENEEQNIL